MKTCKKCRKTFEYEESKCPHCGEPSPESGVFQTSSVLISAGGADLVYRSVDEVPAPLRTKLLKSTNSANSATILIADRRGRAEVAKAVRALPTPAKKRLTRSLIGIRMEGTREWLLGNLRRAALALVLLLAIAVIVFVFVHRWQ